MTMREIMLLEVLPVYGKHFASMYGGSMFGKPAVVFAVWGYVIALMRPSRKDGQCYVELNPTLLAATFATTPDEILEAIATLEAPDPGSRSKVEEGRRLACLSDDKSYGPMQFRVVNGQHYRSMRDEEERREYLRIAKQRSRAKSTLSTESTAVNHGMPPSTQAEVEVEAEKLLPQQNRGKRTDAVAEVFERLWRKYPRRVGKADALRHFRAHAKGAPPEFIEELFVGAIRNYIRDVLVLPREYMHGDRFFNSTWRDFIDGEWVEPAPPLPFAKAKPAPQPPIHKEL